MKEKKIIKTGLPIFFIILAIIIITLLVVFIYKTNDNEPTEKQRNTELNQETAEIISEDKMLQLFSESSDMRVTSINEIYDNKFSINVKYYTRVRISQSEYETMKQTGNIIIDDIIYEYKLSNEYSSLGTIKSSQDDSKEYYVEEILGEYEFQSVDNEGYDLPLTEFNKNFQYEVNQNYMISIYDSNGTLLSYTALKDVDSKWINSPLENIQANISRGPQGDGSEIVIVE